MLRATNLTKTFAGDGHVVRAIDGIDLDIARGEFVSVMGPSGCGKSTLLHCLAGLERPSGGEITFDGERVDGLSETAWAKLRRSRIGVVFQFFNLVANLSVADNVELPALLAGVPASEARRRRQALLDRLGVGDSADVVPGKLSGGQRQRVALARALVNEPDLLLADEPTGSLDSASTAEVLALLQEIHAAGQTIVLVTHDSRVATVADRLLTMRDGRVVDETRLTEGLRDPLALSRLMDVEG